MRAIKTYINDIDRFGLTPAKLYYRASGKINKFPKILSISVPKSGTHLLQRTLLLHPALSRAIVPTLGRRNEEKWKTVESVLGKIRPGRIISSHFDYDPSYDALMLKYNVKALFLIRDPRAIAVSDVFYILREATHPHHKFYKSLPSDRARLLVSLQGNDEEECRPLRDQLARFEGWIDSPAKLVKFEDLVGAQGGGDSETQLQEIAAIYKHLGIDMTNEMILSIAENLFSDKTPTFRSGKIDSWKQYFDDEMCGVFEEECGQLMAKLGYDL